jgi:hypothetical protein
MLKYYLVKNYTRIEDIFYYCQVKDITMAKCRISSSTVDWVVELNDSSSLYSLFMLNYSSCIDNIARPEAW